MFPHHCGSAAIVRTTAILVALAPTLAHATEVQKTFDIQSGPAVDSIAEFGNQARLNILASGDNLVGIITNEVKGRYSVSEALNKLLEGTGLTCRINANGSVFITSTMQRPPPAQGGQQQWERTMTESKSPGQRKAAACAVSAAILLMGAPLAEAQEQANTQAQATPGGSADSAAAHSDGNTIALVKVIGTRASQQSSIERKKNAATAMDSIVADDVGALPDRNVGEAISRMSGVTLDRGAYGEGVSVAVRGNGPDLTRVELDGQAVQSAGGTDMNGGGGGRGVEFRQLSADLIKSVDVVKGSTADMTEGSLGGGIIIKTRTGLDFKKPFVSIRAAGSQSSLNKKWEPDMNVILSNKYLDGRLGLLLNASSTTLANESHSSQVAFSARQGYFRQLDFDNSPDKTFTYQPSTVNASDPMATTPFLRSPLAGGGYFDSATPLDLVTRSANAKTKADCYTAFPALTTDQLNAISPSVARGPATLQRGNELMSCLNQWNDYTPSFLRYFVNREIDKRQNLDLRADFKVNNSLTLYTKGSYNRRHDDINQLTYGQGNLLLNQQMTFSPAYSGPTYTDDLKALTRTVVPGSGYYQYDYPSTYGYSVLSGTVANVDPSSVVVDANHHVTKYTISDGAATTDQLHDEALITARYLQAGGIFRHDGVTAEFFVGDAKSDLTRGQKRISFNNYYGPATLGVLPNGLWGYTLPSGSNFDQSNPAQYAVAYPQRGTSAVPLSTYNTVAHPAYNATQQPLLTQAPMTFWLPTIRDSDERTAKVDVTWATPESIPFFKRFKTGFNLRDTRTDAWDPYAGNSLGWIVKAPVGFYGKDGYVPPVIVPSALLRGTFVGCQDTPGSLGTGGNACQYGFNPSPDPRGGLYGQNVMTVQQFQDIMAQSLTGKATPTRFFSGATGRPVGLIDNWTQIDVEKAFALAKVPNMNFDCAKQCTGSDGKVYDQPVQKIKERSEAFYVMGDFGLDHIPFTDRSLPFGWELDGNMGYRYVRTKVHGTGMMNFRSIVKTDQYDPANPNAQAGIVTNVYSENTSVDAVTHDFLPIYNAAMWLVPDKLVLRYNHAKTVARPPVTQLMPSGTCTYDERLLDGGNVAQTCSGTIGNPALQAQKNVNQNLSLEVYPNKDTMFSVAVFKQEGKIGPAIPQGVNNGRLFSGSGVVDPGTGVALSDLNFDYSTWMNGAATTRKGLELGTKTAFTFLPWLFRYTGFDGNYTKLRSATSSLNVVDLLTGAPMPPTRESKYSYNWAVWYDDGKFSARVAVQAVASYFDCIAGCGQLGMNNYPSAAGGITNRLPYNPGSPNFTDGTRFIDGKIAYKWKPNIEFFVEGRNLGNATTSHSQGPYTPFSDGTPNLLDYAYAGRRIMFGVNFRSM